jgi:hypothetical protein
LDHMYKKNTDKARAVDWPKKKICLV